MSREGYSPATVVVRHRNIFVAETLYLIGPITMSGGKMSGHDETRLADIQHRIEEAQAVVDLQRTLVLELQRNGKDAVEEKRILLRCIEILTLHQEGLERIREAADANA